MFGKRSAEYKTVVQLYKDGKITEEQRDRLIEALDEADGEKSEAEENTVRKGRSGRRIVFKVYGMEDPLDASRVCTAAAEVGGVENARADVKSARLVVNGDFDSDAVAAAVKKIGFHCAPVDVEYYDEDEIEKELDELEEEFDEIEKEFDESEEEPLFAEESETPENGHDEKGGYAFEFGGDDEPSVKIHLGDGDKMSVKMDDGGKKSFKVIMSELGEKISAAVGKGIKAAADAEKNVAVMLGDLFSSNGDGDYSALFDGAGSGSVIKKHIEKFDEPYEDMTVTVKYVNDDVYKFSGKTGESERIKSQCRAVMSDEMFNVLCSLLDEKFTGKYKQVGLDVFKLTVCP